MNNCTLRRTALAIAVVAVLTLPAAANGDGSLSAALGALQAPLATTAQLKILSQVPPPAQVQGPIAPAGVWAKVLATAKRSGKKTELGDSINAYTIKDRIGDLDLNKAAASQNLFIRGQLDDAAQSILNAQFEYVEVTRSPEGVDRYTSLYFRTDGSGRLLSAGLTTVFFKDNKPVGEGTNRELDLADPKTKARYDELLAYWSTRK